MFGQPSIKTIASALRNIEAAAGGAMTKAPRSHLLKVIELLEKSGATSVDQLVSELSTAKATPKKKAAPKPANLELVNSYVDRLSAANSTVQDFERVLSEMLSDKKVRLAQELRQIANRYTGGSVAFKSKADARQAIERKHHGRWVAEQYDRKAS